MGNRYWKNCNFGRCKQQHKSNKKQNKRVVRRSNLRKYKHIIWGSVKSSNAKELFETSDIDGALIGGASLKLDEFEKIINYDK